MRERADGAYSSNNEGTLVLLRGRLLPLSFRRIGYGRLLNLGRRIMGTV